MTTTTKAAASAGAGLVAGLALAWAMAPACDEEPSPACSKRRTKVFVAYPVALAMVGVMSVYVQAR